MLTIAQRVQVLQLRIAIMVEIQSELEEVGCLAEAQELEHSISEARLLLVDLEVHQHDQGE